MKKYLYIALYVCQIMCLPFVHATETPPATSRIMTSAEALKRLIDGNQRYMADKSTCEDRNNERRGALVSKQNPFATILGCSDSRVPLEIIFDQGVGDLFVVRVAGNVAGYTEVESVEYSVKHLNSAIILVLGHEGCGAVEAVITNNAQDFPRLAALIEPAVKPFKDKKFLEQAVKANVRSVVNTLKEDSILKPLLKERKIEIVGGYYQLESGKVEILQ